jgi:hypothetical protein
MQLVVAVGVGVLHRHVRPEHDMFTNGVTKLWIGGHLGRVEGLQVPLDEPLALFLGDLQIAMYRNEVGEPEISGEAVRAAERTQP